MGLPVTATRSPAFNASVVTPLFDRPSQRGPLGAIRPAVRREIDPDVRVLPFDAVDSPLNRDARAEVEERPITVMRVRGGRRRADTDSCCQMKHEVSFHVSVAPNVSDRFDACPDAIEAV